MTNKTTPTELDRTEVVRFIDRCQEDGMYLQVEYKDGKGIPGTPEALISMDGETDPQRKYGQIADKRGIPWENFISVSRHFDYESGDIVKEIDGIEINGNGLSPEQILRDSPTEISAYSQEDMMGKFREDPESTIGSEMHIWQREGVFYNQYAERMKTFLGESEPNVERHPANERDLIGLDIPYNGAIAVMEVAQELGLANQTIKKGAPGRFFVPGLFYYKLTEAHRKSMQEMQTGIPSDMIKHFMMGFGDSAFEYDLVTEINDTLPARSLVDRYLERAVFLTPSESSESKEHNLVVGTLEGPRGPDRNGSGPGKYTLTIKNHNAYPHDEKEFEKIVLPKAREFVKALEERLGV